jgi:hypothetical protein
MGHNFTSLKVVCYIRNVSWSNPSSQTMAHGSTKPVIKMNTRNLPASWSVWLWSMTSQASGSRYPIYRDNFTFLRFIRRWIPEAFTISARTQNPTQWISCQVMEGKCELLARIAHFIKWLSWTTFIWLTIEAEVSSSQAYAGRVCASSSCWGIFCRNSFPSNIEVKYGTHSLVVLAALRNKRNVYSARSR